jgi:hypothetical protein
MAVVVNNALLLHAAQLLFGNEASYPWTVDLYVNLVAPLPSSPLSSFVLCSLSGYSAFQISGSQWAGGLQSQGVVFYQQPLMTFNFNAYASAQQTIFGYVVHNGSTVLYAELFPAPFPVPSNGGSLPLLLTWSDEQCPA